MTTPDLDGLLARPRTGDAARDALRRRTARRRRLRRTLTLLVILVALGFGAQALWDAVHPRLMPAGCEVSQSRGGPFGYPPDKFANAATISAVSVKRDLPTRAAEIAIATALQESKLRNIEHGDLDSLGLFQQRPSQGWGTPTQILDPVYAVGAFYDHLVKVRAWQTRPLTQVAQAVQRSGYPDAYARHEAEAAALAAAFTGDRAASAVCRLDDPSQTWSRQRVRQQLTRETGLASRDTPTGLEVDAPDARTAWMVGSWAVAHAHAHGTLSVTVADRIWTRTLEERGLRWDPAPGPTAAATVHIQLTRPAD